MRFLQTVGGRTGVPLPRPVRHPPFVQWRAPIVWTTLAMTIHADGRTDLELAGASSFPRHWVYDHEGALSLKSGLTDQKSWVAESFGDRTPWGDQDSPVVVAAVETDLERQISADIMEPGRQSSRCDDWRRELSSRGRANPGMSSSCFSTGSSRSRSTGSVWPKSDPAQYWGSGRWSRMVSGPRRW